jgi:hypothetical protein
LQNKNRVSQKGTLYYFLGLCSFLLLLQKK